MSLIVVYVVFVKASVTDASVEMRQNAFNELPSFLTAELFNCAVDGRVEIRIGHVVFSRRFIMRVFRIQNCVSDALLECIAISDASMSADVRGDGAKNRCVKAVRLSPLL